MEEMRLISMHAAGQGTGGDTLSLGLSGMSQTGSNGGAAPPYCLAPASIEGRYNGRVSG
jgi:hypothetical protein